MKWQSLKRFCDLNFPDITFKNDAMRRQHVLKKGLKIQKDDKGADGVCIPKEGDANPDEEKEMRVGKRLEASKLRQEDWGDGAGTKEQREANHARNSAGLAVESNRQDPTNINH